MGPHLEVNQVLVMTQGNILMVLYLLVVTVAMELRVVLLVDLELPALIQNTGDREVMHL